MSILRNWRRRRIRRRPFPVDWERFLRETVPLYVALPAPDQRELQSHVLVFLAEKHFEGCAGVRITDEVRLAIAAQACILLLHRPTNYFSRVISILVYPATYVDRRSKHHDGPIVTEGSDSRAGEAWPYGTVVLSWEDIITPPHKDDFAVNIVLHEFAHELDFEFDLTTGIESTDPDACPPWAQVVEDEYENLKEDVERDRPTLMNPYGATNLAEFFAVATETFFEIPHDLRRYHPELYDVLKSFYHLDPAI